MRQTRRSVLVLSALIAALLAGCSEDEVSCELDTSYHPVIDPAAFVAVVDHPLFPLTPGTRYVYEGQGEHVEVTVTQETKQILGVACVVVRDTVTVDGELIEDTFDWYAQDSDGNVWYMGEDTKEYENGQVASTEGSWEAGVDGAEPGIVMPAQPQPGTGAYRQEYYLCQAEDEAEVLSVDDAVTVPLGSYTGCVTTHEFTRLEPDVNEDKIYCPDVGLVLEVDVPSGGRTELIEMTSI
jgi:hypothetical protein